MMKVEGTYTPTHHHHLFFFFPLSEVNMYLRFCKISVLVPRISKYNVSLPHWSPPRLKGLVLCITWWHSLVPISLTLPPPIKHALGIKKEIQLLKKQCHSTLDAWCSLLNHHSLSNCSTHPSLENEH